MSSSSLLPNSATSSGEQSFRSPPPRRRVELETIPPPVADDRLPPDVLGVRLAFKERDAEATRTARSRNAGRFEADLALAFELEGGDYALAQAIYFLEGSLYISTDSIDSSKRLKRAIENRMPESTGLQSPRSIEIFYALNEFQVSSRWTDKPDRQDLVVRACSDMLVGNTVHVQRFMSNGSYVVNVIDERTILLIASRRPSFWYFEGSRWKFQPWNRSMQHQMCVHCWGFGHGYRRCSRIICGFCGKKGHKIERCELKKQHDRSLDGATNAKRIFRDANCTCPRCNRPGHGPKDIDICQHVDAVTERNRMATAKAEVEARFAALYPAPEPSTQTSSNSLSSGSQALPAFVEHSLLSKEETRALRAFSQHLPAVEDSAEEEVDIEGDDDDRVIPETPIASQTVPISASQASQVSSPISADINIHAAFEEATAPNDVDGDVPYHLEDLERLEARIQETVDDAETILEALEESDSDTDPALSGRYGQNSPPADEPLHTLPRPMHLESMLGTQVPQDELASISSAMASPISQSNDASSAEEPDVFLLDMSPSPPPQPRKTGRTVQAKSMSTDPQSTTRTFRSNASRTITSQDTATALQGGRSKASISKGPAKAPKPRAARSMLNSATAAISTTMSPSTPDQSQASIPIPTPPPTTPKRKYTRKPKDTQDNEYTRVYPAQDPDRERSSAYGLRKSVASRKHTIVIDDDDDKDWRPARATTSRSAASAPSAKRRKTSSKKTTSTEGEQRSTYFGDAGKRTVLHSLGLGIGKLFGW